MDRILCITEIIEVKKKLIYLQIKKFITKKKNDPKDINELVLKEIPKYWDKYDVVIGEHLHLDHPLKISKIMKHGIKALFRNPNAIFKKGRTIRFHFDMFHSNGNLDKAMDVLYLKDREDFRNFTRSKTSFNRGSMFICRSKKIINYYYESIFPWLFECEKVFGYDLKGYGKVRMYAFLAERYLSYWFTKYTNPLLWPIVHFDTIHE